MYVFVNRFKEISNCMLCESKNSCKCEILNVFIHEDFMFYKMNKQHLLNLNKVENINEDPWLKNYRNQEAQKNIVIEVKNLFPNVKNIYIFPSNPDLISFAENIDDNAKF